MKKATRHAESTQVKELVADIFRWHTGPQHFTVKHHYMIAVLKDAQSVLIYDFRRSLRPLARITSGGEDIIVRDFFDVETTVQLLKELRKMVTIKGNYIAHGVCAEEFKGTDRGPVVQLNSEGKVTLVDVFFGHMARLGKRLKGDS